MNEKNRKNEKLNASFIDGIIDKYNLLKNFKILKKHLEKNLEIYTKIF